jgi:two-component system, chemotaxis family, CheB/CheR fusion protein
LNRAQNGTAGPGRPGGLDGDGASAPPVTSAPATQFDSFSRELIEALPCAIYTTDASGRMTFYNEAAAAIWGRQPELGEEYCGSWKIYASDGTPVPLDQCPMAVAVKERRAVRGIEAVVERPDGTRISLIPYPTPMYNASGEMIGAVNVLVDISERKRAEETLAQRVREQAALYEFTDRLYRAASRDDVYGATLDAINAALGCERASILLFDEAGALSFVAWRGLSEAYRRAVAGHSPWSRDTKDPQPLCIEDIDNAPGLAALKDTLRSEGIGALAFIPVVVGGELVGKFMTYHPSAHVFSDAEVDLAVTIARQLGFGIERFRAEDARRQDEQTKELLVGEIKHRIKNTLGTVLAIAAQTFRQAPGQERDAFTARLIALASAHDLMTQKNWQNARVADIVARATAPFEQPGAQRFSISGPEALLNSSKAQMLAMALHELGTNAAKYGALSQPGGQVTLSWAFVGEPGARRLKFDWRECGGPTVEPPDRKGFGTTLIEHMLDGDTGSARLQYLPTGLVCNFELAV